MNNLYKITLILFVILFPSFTLFAQSKWNFMEPDEVIFFDKSNKSKAFSNKIFSSNDFKIRYKKKSNELKVNYKQDLSKLQIQDLRLLKFTLLAKNGYIFQDATLRDYFCNQKWFQPIYWDSTQILTLTKEDVKLYNKIKILEDYYIKSKAKDSTFKYSDICNSKVMDFTNLEAIKKLETNGFVIDNNSKDFFWHIYEQNRYEQIPSFITSDAFLHIVNLYYQYVLNSIERKSLIPIVDSLCYSIYNLASNDIINSKDSNIIDQAKFVQFYYGIACKLLNHKNIKFDSTYSSYANDYYTMAMQADMIYEDNSIFNDKIPFNLFKPRGNYNSSEKMRAYFRTVSWLGLVPFKVKSTTHFERIKYLTSIMKKNTETDELYNTYTKLVSFLVGKGDNISLFDVLNLDYSNKNEFLKGINKFSKGRIIEQGDSADLDLEIYTLPKSYTPDSEVITKVINIVNGPERREFPRGLDILASLEVNKAEDLLVNYYKENDTWKKYSSRLEQAKSIFRDNINKDNAYSYWLKMIFSLFQKNNSYPYVMKKDAWEIKSLNSGLASYAQLKHNTILYSEQASGAEQGEGDDEGYILPDPSMQVAFVEANIEFWTKASEFINKLNSVSKLYSSDKELSLKLNYAYSEVSSLCNYLLEISNKELSKQKLTYIDFSYINSLGSKFEDLEKVYLQMEYDKEFENTPTSQDSAKEESFSNYKEDVFMFKVADIYTINNDCLELGIGKAKEIYTIVNINGYDYLCKGGVYSYYEFPYDANNRLTDQDWKMMVEDDKLPELQPWFTPYIMNVNSKYKGYLVQYPKSFIKKE